MFRLAKKGCCNGRLVVVVLAAAMLALGLLTGPAKAFAPRQSPLSPLQLQQRPALTRRGASEEGGGGSLVDKLFGLFFGKKEERPLGFDRISVETSPEVYPATIDKFADPLPGA